LELGRRLPAKAERQAIVTVAMSSAAMHRASGVWLTA